DLYAPDFHSAFPQRFDLIVSNPPYVSESEYDELPPTVRNYEPKIALWAGADGLQAIRGLAEVGTKLLKVGGCLICEIGELQGHAAKTIFEGFEWDAVVKNDLSGKPRYLIARAA
ncbi:MAG TPA: peptide chain release factor N(5)-glutamine methyltransferase, partial [bacterium]